MTNTREIGLAKNASPGTILRAPGFTDRTPNVTHERITVQYEGDSRPRIYRGDGTSVDWRINLIFSSSSADAATFNSFKSYLDTSQTDPDPRFILWPGLYWNTQYPTGILTALSGTYQFDSFNRPSGLRHLQFVLTEVI